MKSAITFLIFLISAISAQAQPGLRSDSFEKSVDDLVQAYTDLGIFSGVVLVAEEGKPVYHKAFGLADRSTGRMNTTETRFDIGSMNKSFTKVAVLKLIHEDKLSMDDPLGKYLDGFSREVSENVTIRHLLTHTSGFGDYHGPDYFDRSYDEKKLWPIVEILKGMPLMFPPGEEQAYSNAGYVLLGAIMEKAAGKDFFDLINELVVQPLGLENTYLREKYNTPNRAIGYMLTMRGELESNDVFNDPPKPDGGFYSTTEDILKFYRAYFYGNTLWTDEVRKLDPMYPFLQEHMDSGGAIPHAGGFGGSNTVLYEILRDRITVVVFANMDEVVAEDLGAGILAIIRGLKPKQPAYPAIPLIYQSYREQGINYVEDHFEELSANWHPADPKDWILNNIGYNLLYSGIKGEQQQAIEILELNTRLFPEVANTWDSLGEAWKATGNKEKAISCYQKALKLDPGLESARDALKELQEK